MHIEIKKFYADWCGPCKILTPILDAVVSDLTDEGYSVTLNPINIDSDEGKEETEKYSIRNIPATIIFHNGRVIDTFVGTQTKDTIKNKILEKTNVCRKY